MSNNDKVREALEIFEKAQEAAMIQLRMNLGLTVHKPSDLARLPFDATKISWQPKEREDKSKWELASDRDNQNNSDYRALRQFLSQEKKTVSEGQFYWLMDTAVGRQLNKKGKP